MIVLPRAGPIEVFAVARIVKEGGDDDWGEGAYYCEDF